MRWVQDCLNHAMGLQLPVTGAMGPDTRSGLRSFQRQQGLRASGIVGPDTEEALRAACDGQRPFNFEVESFDAYRNFDDELEVKIIVDEPGKKHITKQIEERFADPADRTKIINRINQLVGMTAPPEAVGPYEWYVQVGNLGDDGKGWANIVVVGHMIRSVLQQGMIVRGRRYVIRKGVLRQAGA
ncbi:MAG: peptidoglycan-binding domain-containing protein [Pseudomonadota bacterium]